MPSPKKLLIVLAGATAVGKTAFAISLAKLLNTEIVSADSRQLYQELHIGTAKPSTEEMQGIKHHFIDSHSIKNYFSVGDYEKEAIQTIEHIFEKKNIALLVGGSGMFLKVICNGIDAMPDADLDIRETLMQRLEKESLENLRIELKTLDPISFANIDPSNTQRIVRALEVCLATNKPFSSFKKNTPIQRNFAILKIVLDLPREELYARIDQRVNIMVKNGLVEEVKNVLPFREHYALKTVGYKEVFDYLDGKNNEKEMIELIQRNTRRFAKRQLTWFKNQDTFAWFSIKEKEKIMAYIQENIKNL